MTGSYRIINDTMGKDIYSNPPSTNSMGLSELLNRNISRLKRREFKEFIYEGGYELYSASWRLGKLLPIDETNIFDREWDVLIILDGCRVDLLKQVTEEYSFLNEVDEISSVGSMSIEWMEKTFGNAPAEELRSTAYVTANLFSKDICQESNLYSLEEVWKYSWDDDLNTIPARSVTDKSINLMRSSSPDRLIVHYMQPHHPFVSDKEEIVKYNPDPFGRDNDGISDSKTVWGALRRGEIDYDSVWNSYKNNLRYVLDDVSLLRKNMDAEKLVISADHGNAVGEWGVYDHPIGFPHPCVKNVPWVETSATDTHTYEPSTSDKTSTPDINDQLSALGYK